MSGMKGRGLKILHIYQDNLWALGDRTIPVPNIPIQETTTEIKTEKLETKNEENVLDQVEEKLEETKIDNEKIQESETQQENELKEENVLDHEKILTDSFLCAIKFKSKEFKLPVIVSTFMKTLQSCWYCKISIKKI